MTVTAVRASHLSTVRLISMDRAERNRALVDALEETLSKEVERARAALVDVIGKRITLQPDESGEVRLWAELEFQATPLLAAVGSPEIMVAGA